MIPKTIHYCWFGHNPKPKLAQKCIRSWKRFCPGYEIIEWNEDNFDITSCPLYVQQAYASGKWAFVTDYVRLKVVYEHGGVYLDTDVELKKSLDPLLVYHAYFGFEDGIHIATGLGFGAEKGTPVLQEMMADYQHLAFLQSDGSYDAITCPVRNTKVFLKYGLVQDDSQQILPGDILILPSIYLCPIVYNSNKYRRSRDTFSIHWFDASWRSQEEKENHAKYLRREKLDKLRHFPNHLLHYFLGQKNYEKLKKLLKRAK